MSQNTPGTRNRGRPKVRPRPSPARPAAREKPVEKENRIHRAIVDGVMEQRLKPGTKLPRRPCANCSG